MSAPLAIRTALPFALVLGLSGCGPQQKTSAILTAHPSVHAHTHETQHGGVAVELGEEEYHVEFTFGETPGTLEAYFLDGEMEDYVRLAIPSFTATANVGGRDFPLQFEATTNSATGEKSGDSALFEARAEWLIARPDLKLTVPALAIKGHDYTNLSVALPARSPPKPVPTS